MSTPNERPGPDQSDPQQPGYQAPPPGYQQPGQQNPNPGYQQPGQQNPNPGYQQPGQQNPNPGYQQPAYQQPGHQAPPPGYQQPGYQAPPPGYQQPAYQQQRPTGDTSFQMPTDWPKDMRAVMPATGFSGLFKVDGLPQLLKVSYIIWLVSAGIWLLGTVFKFLFSVVFINPRGVVTSIISLALIALLLICLMKLKEGMQWARFVLSGIALLSIVLTFFGAGSGVLGVVAAVLMWLPESSAWLNSRKGAVS